jgi:hypothetical protein
MNRFFLFLLPAALLVACGPSSSKEKNDPAERAGEEAGIFGVESGIVEYAFSEDSLEHEILYFDRFGTRQAKLRYNSGTGDSSLTIEDGAMTYTIDLRGRTGSKMKNPFGTSDMGSVLGYKEERMERMAGATKTGQKEIMGHTCDVWTNPATDLVDVETRTCFYKGVNLAMALETGGEIVTVNAVKFEENAKVGDEKFKVPAGIDFDNN